MAAAFAELERYAQERDALLMRITQALTDDPRVRAAWLSGSFGRGEADEWADFDLHVAVDDAFYQEFLGERPSLYECTGRPILVQPEMASDSMPGGRFQLVLYAGCLEVDWNIGPLSQALRPVAFQMLLERAAVPIVSPSPLSPGERLAAAEKWLVFFWAMAPIAVKHVGRLETRRAAEQIGLLSRASVALQRLLIEPDGPDPVLPWTNRPLEAGINASLPQLGASIDPLTALSVIRELCAAVEQLHGDLTSLGVSVPTAVPDEVRTLATLAEAAARRGETRQRKYR